MVNKFVNKFANSKVQSIGPSASSSLNDKAMELRAAGKKIVNLTIGEPNFDTPKRIKEAAYKSIEAGFTHYVPAPGVSTLRESIAKKLQNENDIEVDPVDEIIVTPGAKFAIYLAIITFLEEGDEVLILDPSWVSYKPLVQLSGAKPVSVPLHYDDNFKITREKLEKNVTSKTKMIIINSPNNPTGRVFTKEEVKEINQFILDHNILAISDEIYEHIVYDNFKNISLASDPSVKESIITINGFSKSYAMTGWRLGYIAAEKELVKEMVKVQQHLVSCATSFSQYAAIEAFDCESEVNLMVEDYKRRRDFLVSELNSLPGFECRSPEGTFYVFAKVNYNGMNSEEFSQYIFENAGVLVTPGAAYNDNECIRLSFAASMEELEAGVESLKKVLYE
ncbi:pyridoxal phosphate-dependent aminotransferase [Oceanobacillus alkalisoli]|uniref:pyridoxal phosphate-dependent aminotransferase n=1 Tax=Oceanobacillus alkalisoli TaxID=2925113 RepID=UPI001EE3A5C9|nr:pyridoxal phosphate-dependent aminotransferase [Oceanobacillus alkalisoli]MCG5103231.1 pyridoxal phosphate-dependent aminotransferase [Oceanobacillus alkalisoli]